MSEPTTPAEAAERNIFVFAQPPASDALLVDLMRCITEWRAHKHPDHEDFHCANLVGYMGERMTPVLARLIAAEAEVTQLRAELAALKPHDHFRDEHHLTRLRQVFTQSARELYERGPDVIADQLHMYLTGAMWAVERENERVVRIAEAVVAQAAQQQDGGVPDER